MHFVLCLYMEHVCKARNQVFVRKKLMIFTIFIITLGTILSDTLEYTKKQENFVKINKLKIYICNIYCTKVGYALFLYIFNCIDVFNFRDLMLVTVVRNIVIAFHFIISV